MNKIIYTFNENPDSNYSKVESNGSNAFNANHRKKSNFYKSIKLIKFDTLNNEFSTVADLRVYATTARHYACIWIGEYSSSSYAGGYGYHSESAAVYDALEKLGLSCDIRGGLGGHGSFWYEDALLFIVKSLENNDNDSSLYHMIESYA